MGGEKLVVVLAHVAGPEYGYVETSLAPSRSPEVSLDMHCLMKWIGRGRNEHHHVSRPAATNPVWVLRLGEEAIKICY